MSILSKMDLLSKRGLTLGNVISFVPFVLVGIVLLMVIPLPSWVLDFLIAASIALAVTLLLISIHLEKPLDLSSFPTILLFVTLLRLSLNVASTRLILLRGAEGTDAAGGIIRAFGEFMVGGNYVVGAAVFVLLVIINFVVITKGAGRVAEVSARFTLDALPGKQMSIDSDLAAGAITQEEAKVRRKTIENESDFFGAMDGASKFVRGDAIAGLLMTGINIVVGFIVGVAQQGMSAAEAGSTYTVLTVGDGLASQIPALLISTAAGVIVTRAASDLALAPALISQLGSHKKALYATSGVLAMVGLVPGMPVLPFFTLAGAVAFAGRHAAAVASDSAPNSKQTDSAHAEPSERERLEEMLPLELLELEVGFDLVPLVDGARGGELVERIAGIRRNLAKELGLIVPSIHIRDNLQLKSSEYRLLLSGNEVGGGELQMGGWLAMDPTGTLEPMEGKAVKEPAFGLPAVWIKSGHKEKAEMIGYTVVDVATVAATHITEMLKNITPELLGRSEVQELLDVLAKKDPRLVDEVIPNILPLGDVIQVLKNLLSEGISIRDLRTILEVLADYGRQVKDPRDLTEFVREGLARHITSRFRDPAGQVSALILDPKAEDVFRHGPDTSGVQAILSSLDQAASAFAGVSTPPVLVCAADVRRAVSDFLVRKIPGLSVLSYREIEPRASVRSLGIVTV